MSQTTFDRLGLPNDLTAALAAQRITEPFAIQGLTLPDALAGRDILGRAPTGSGKTLAFGLPVLARLAATDRAAKRRPRALILSPTRELAEQIQRELEPLASAVGRRGAAVYGGAAIGRQIKALAKGVDLLVATPGRLLDLIDQGEVALDQVEIAVVDEADRMADMGFLPDVRRILDQTEDDRQTLLFSATLDGDVKQLTDRYQRDPATHEVGDPEPDLSLVEHRFLKVAKNARLDLAADLLDDAGPSVVFVRTRHGVDRLARQLRQRGVKAGYIHGGRSQSQRTRALDLFTNGKVDILVATDVAARGIHVDGVTCVLHYDPPADTKDYVHRSGRTARAGAGGTVISLLDPSQVKASQKMQRELGLTAELETPKVVARKRPVPEPAPESDPSSDAAPERPSKSRRSSTAAPSSKARRSPKAKAKHAGHGSQTAKAKDGSRSKDGSRNKAGRSTGEDHQTPRSDGDGRPADGAKAKAGAKRPAGSKGRGGPKARSGPKAKAKGPKDSSGRRATKRSGRSRPPNRKGKVRSSNRRSPAA